MRSIWIIAFGDSKFVANHFQPNCPIGKTSKLHPSEVTVECWRIGREIELCEIEKAVPFKEINVPWAYSHRSGAGLIAKRWIK